MPKISKIKTFIVTDETDDKGYISSQEVRNEAGGVLLQEHYTRDGAVENKIIREFDDQNRLIEEYQFSWDEDPDQVLFYEYNAGGQLAQVKIQYRDGSLSYKKYTIDAAEHTESLEIIDEDGGMEGTEFRRFDKEGRVLEEKIVEEGELVKHSKISYDDSGRPLHRSFLDIDGVEQGRKYIYEVDDNGRVAGLKVLNKQGTVLREDHIKYDEKGNEIEHFVKDLEQGYGSLSKWEYDDKDRIVVQQSFGGGGNLKEEVKYKYTEHDLLKEQESRSGQGVFLNYYEYEFHNDMAAAEK